MQNQKTKSVIARQLSGQELTNYFFPRPYPIWAWAALGVGVILIVLALITKNLFISIVGIVLILVGLFFLWQTKRSNPDDQQYDAWVENQGQALYKRGLHALDITRSQMSDRMLHIRSYVLPGSFDANDYDPDTVWMKRGKDGYWRFSINVYTYIYPLPHYLAVFRGDINAFEPRLHNDLNEMYAYYHIIGATTVSDPEDAIFIGGQKFPYQTEQFCLKISNGDSDRLSATIKAKPPGSLSSIPAIVLPDTGFNKTLNILRKLILSKHSGI
jgi:hypothetical protein